MYLCHSLDCYKNPNFGPIWYTTNVISLSVTREVSGLMLTWSVGFGDRIEVGIEYPTGTFHLEIPENLESNSGKFLQF